MGLREKMEERGDCEWLWPPRSGTCDPRRHVLTRPSQAGSVLALLGVHGARPRRSLEPAPVHPSELQPAGRTRPKSPAATPRLAAWAGGLWRTAAAPAPCCRDALSGLVGVTAAHPRHGVRKRVRSEPSVAPTWAAHRVAGRSPGRELRAREASGGRRGDQRGRGRLWTQRPTRLELQAQPPDATSPTKRGTLSPGKTGSPGPATRASNPERVRLKSRLLLTTGKRLPACAARVGGNGPCSPSEATRNPRARRHVDLVMLEAPRPRSHRTGVPIERTRPDESVTRVDQALLCPTCEMSPRPGQRCALPSLPRSGCGDGGL